MNDKPSRMDYRQHQAARRLVHECCNYDEGNCLLLDDGEPCVCVQSISYSLMCRWFRVAVLPLDGELAAALLYQWSRKRCAVWWHTPEPRVRCLRLPPRFHNRRRSHRNTWRHCYRPRYPVPSNPDTHDYRV